MTDFDNDDEFEKDLLEFLNSAKYSLLTLHGELINRWMETENAGPLLLFVYDKILDENFRDEVTALPKVQMFSVMITAENPEMNYHLMILSKTPMFAFGLFGADLTPQEFYDNLQIAKQYYE